MADKLGEELLSASRTGDLEGVKCCLEKGRNFRRSSLFKKGLNRAFHEAVYGNKAEVVETLVRVEAVGIDTKGAGGLTPLMVASQQGHVECVTLLLKLGADAGIKEWMGKTAGDLAKIKGYSHIVELLNTKDNLCTGVSHSDLHQRMGELENTQNMTATIVTDVESRCGDLETSQNQLARAVKDLQVQMSELQTRATGKVKKNQGTSGADLIYDKIRSNYKQFVTDLTATDHLAFLFQSGVIELHHMEEIKSGVNRLKQTEALLEKLMARRDRQWVYSFKQSLEEDSGSSHLANLLSD